MSDSMLSWLRSQIESDKAKAEAALDDGSWYEDDGWLSDWDGCNMRRVVEAHIVTQSPRDTIARCEAELALLDEMIPMIQELDDIAMGEGQGSVPYEYPVRRLVELLASGYKHRPGFGSWEAYE